METKKCLSTFIGTFLVLLFVLPSCNTAKITAVSCPEFPGNKFNKALADNRSNQKKPLHAHYGVKTRKQPTVGYKADMTKKHPGKNIIVFNNSPIKKYVKVTDLERITGLTKIEYSQTLLASIDNTIILGKNNVPAFSLKEAEITDSPEDIIVAQLAGCDTIILKSGSVYIGKVEEIGQNEIKYRRCDNLSGPIISILKSDVSLIKYSNGNREVISTPSNAVAHNSIQQRDDNGQKQEYLGLIGSSIGTLGMAIGAISLSLVGLWLWTGLAAVILGSISLRKLKKHPEKYLNVQRSKTTAWTSIVIGAIAIIAFVIIVAIIG